MEPSKLWDCDLEKFDKHKTFQKISEDYSKK